MKNYTPALVNPDKPKLTLKTFLLGNVGAKNHYYKARHKTEDIFIMWIESGRLGRNNSFPCVLEEQGDALVYFTGKNNVKQNAMLISRWGLFCIPQSFESDFEYEEMQARDFNEMYNGYKTRDIARELEKHESSKPREPDSNPAE